jgi:hypothetical protein
LVDVVQHLESFAGQQLGEVDMRVLADEVLVDLDGAGIRWDDSFSSAVGFCIDEPFLDEVGDGTREVALAMVELRRELGDRIAASDRGEDLEFGAPKHSMT